MADANGEFVKVYLFLLRHLDDPCSSITISTIADCLNNTEKDILRAFRYWESAGLLTVVRDADDKITGLELRRTSFSKKESATCLCRGCSETGTYGSSESKAVPLDAFRTQKELKSLFLLQSSIWGKP